jgi:hypothetical protein
MRGFGFTANPLPAAKLDVLADAVTAACDGGDTVTDGLVATRGAATSTPAC